jgi:hypothetical protein
VAVENGRLTQEEADARLAQLRERVTERINEPGLPERPDRGERPDRENGPLSIVADALGMTVEELLAALDDETSIADVAAAQGVAVEDVVDELMERAADHMQVAVENGQRHKISRYDQSCAVPPAIALGGQEQGRCSPDCVTDALPGAAEGTLRALQR